MNFRETGDAFEKIMRLLPPRPEALEEIDRLSAAYSEAWGSSASPPRLDAVLARTPPDLRAPLAFLLIQIEIHRRAKIGDWPQPGEYAPERFPELAAALRPREEESTPADAADGSSFGPLPSFQALIADFERAATSDHPRANGEGLDALGARIGSWTIESVIGRGGMGVVYRARGDDGRLAALKAIHPGLLHYLEGDKRRDLIDRFRREGDLACSLPRHEHIVSALEVGASQGFLYLAMELMERGAFRLDPALAATPSSHRYRVIAKHALKVARAVEHCHEHGVVHCDLKLSNLFFNAKGEPCVSDFGIARSVHESRRTVDDGGLWSLLTFRSPSYSAPEAIVRPLTADPRTDVYGVGVILYELLTGGAPFAAVCPTQVMRMVLHNAPERPSRIGVNKDMPPALESICLKCLRKRPGQRYASARELAADLERFLAGQPVRASRIGEHVARARLAVRRNAGLLVLAGLGLVVVAPFAATRWHARALAQSDPKHIAEHVSPDSWSPEQWSVAWLPRDSGEFGPELARAASGDRAAAERLAQAFFFSDERIPFLDPRAEDPASIPAIARIIDRVSPDFGDRLAARLRDSNASNSSLLRAAVALAHLNPKHADWPRSAPYVANALNRTSVKEAEDWARLLAPVGEALTESAIQICRDREDALSVALGLGLWLADDERWLRFASEANERQAAWLIHSLVRFRQPLSRERIEARLEELDQKWRREAQPNVIADDDRLALSRARVNLALAQWASQDHDAAWRRLTQIHDGDFSFQTELIHRLPQIQIGWPKTFLLERLDDPRTTDAQIRVAILALGEKPFDEYADFEQERLRVRLKELQGRASAAVRCSADWLLENWRLGSRSDQLAPPPGADWRVSSQGHLLIRVPTAERVAPDLSADPRNAPEDIEPGYEIAAHEVSWGQYRRFLRAKNRPEIMPPKVETALRGVKAEDLDQCPALQIQLEDVQAYCEWLTTEEIRNGGDPKRIYRLPSGAEWENATRAGSRTAWFFGESPYWIEKYANVAGASQWARSAGSRPAVTGKARPNPWGIFDLIGNAHERSRSASIWMGGGYNLHPQLSKSDTQFPDQNLRSEYGFRVVCGTR